MAIEDVEAVEHHGDGGVRLQAGAAARVRILGQTWWCECGQRRCYRRAKPASYPLGVTAIRANVAIETDAERTAICGDTEREPYIDGCCGGGGGRTRCPSADA
jgi:hypothetical protein